LIVIKFTKHRIAAGGERAASSIDAVAEQGSIGGGKLR
jgi:hypothetical protein